MSQRHCPDCGASEEHYSSVLCVANLRNQRKIIAQKARTAIAEKNQLKAEYTQTLKAVQDEHYDRLHTAWERIAKLESENARLILELAELRAKVARGE